MTIGAHTHNMDTPLWRDRRKFELTNRGKTTTLVMRPVPNMPGQWEVGKWVRFIGWAPVAVPYDAAGVKTYGQIFTTEQEALDAFRDHADGALGEEWQPGETPQPTVVISEEDE